LFTQNFPADFRRKQSSSRRLIGQAGAAEKNLSANSCGGKVTAERSAPVSSVFAQNRHAPCPRREEFLPHFTLGKTQIYITKEPPGLKFNIRKVRNEKNSNAARPGFRQGAAPGKDSPPFSCPLLRKAVFGRLPRRRSALEFRFGGRSVPRRCGVTTIGPRLKFGPGSSLRLERSAPSGPPARHRLFAEKSASCASKN